MHDAGLIDSQHVFPVGAVDRVQRLATLGTEAWHGAETRVGDRHIDASLLLDDLVEELLHPVAVGDVADECAGVAAVRAQLLGRRGQPVLVDVRKRDAGAAVREHLGHCEAEPAGRAGDDDARAADVEQPRQRLRCAISHLPLLGRSRTRIESRADRRRNALPPVKG